MTASAMLGDRDKCIEAGMDDYIAKPVRPDHVRSTLENWGAKVIEQQGSRAGNAEAEKANQLSEMQQEPNSSSPVDMERLMEFSDGTTESLRELITLYIDQTGKQLEQLRLAVQDGKASDVRQVAHSCAGASATCGMITLAPLLRELERLGTEQKLEAAPDLCAQCDREFARIRTTLLATLPPAPQAAR
jgi:HPt (histidine-containing phosphotransfer) domain-containing protein